MTEWEKQEVKEGLGYIGIAIIVLLIIILIGGLIGIGYKYVFGTANANVNREIYKNNASYIDGQIKDLSDYKQEYEKAKKEGDINGANAVIGYIKDDFSNFPIDKIENELLKEFLKDVINGYYDEEE